MKNTLIQHIGASVLVSQDFTDLPLIANLTTKTTLKIDSLDYFLKVGKVKDIPLPSAFYSLEDILAILGQVPTNYVTGGPKLRGSNIRAILKGLLLANDKAIWDDGATINLRPSSVFEVEGLNIRSNYILSDLDPDGEAIGINELEVRPDVDIWPLDYLSINGQMRLVLAVRVPLIKDVRIPNPYRLEEEGPRKVIVF